MRNVCVVATIDGGVLFAIGVGSCSVMLVLDPRS